MAPLLLVLLSLLCLLPSFYETASIDFKETSGETAISLTSNLGERCAISIKPEDVKKALKLRINSSYSHSYYRGFDSETLATTIAQNVLSGFVDVHYLKKNGISSYNVRALSDLEKYPEILEFLGFAMCLTIVHSVFDALKRTSYYNQSQEKRTLLLLVISLCDFLEFVLYNLSPKYEFSREDAKFNLGHWKMMERETAKLVMDIIPLSDYSGFGSIEPLLVILDRFEKSLSDTTITSLLSIIYSDTKVDKDMFREALVALVSKFPRTFCDISNYSVVVKYSPPDQYMKSVIAFLGPLYRLFLMRGEDECFRETLLSKFLKEKIEKASWWNLSDKTVIKAIDFLMFDTRFSVFHSSEEFNARSKFMKTFLSKVLKIVDTEQLTVFMLAALDADANFLYEVLLIFYRNMFSESKRNRLLQKVMLSRWLARETTAITLAYLDFSEQDIFAAKAHVNSIFSFDGSWIWHLKISKQFLEHSLIVLNSVPSSINGIDVNRSASKCLVVDWPCPPEIIVSKGIKFEERDPYTRKLKVKYDEYACFVFQYMRIILARKFGIPFMFTAISDSTLEALIWNEGIGFLNVFLDRWRQLLHPNMPNDVVQFKDSTDYAMLSLYSNDPSKSFAPGTTVTLPAVLPPAIPVRSKEGEEEGKNSVEKSNAEDEALAKDALSVITEAVTSHSEAPDWNEMNEEFIEEAINAFIDDFTRSMCLDETNNSAADDGDDLDSVNGIFIEVGSVGSLEYSAATSASPLKQSKAVVKDEDDFDDFEKVTHEDVCQWSSGGFASGNVDGKQGEN